MFCSYQNISLQWGVDHWRWHRDHYWRQLLWRTSGTNATTEKDKDKPQTWTKTKTITKTATNFLMDYRYKDNQRQTKGQEQWSSLPLFSFSLFILLFFLSLFYSPKMPQVVFGTMLVWSELITSHAIRWAVVVCLLHFAFCVLCFMMQNIWHLLALHCIALQGANTSPPHSRGGRGHLELQVQDVLQGSPGQICLCL